MDFSSTRRLIATWRRPWSVSDESRAARSNAGLKVRSAKRRRSSPHRGPTNNNASRSPTAPADLDRHEDPGCDRTACAWRDRGAGQPGWHRNLVLVLELSYRLNRGDRESAIVAVTSSRPSEGAWSNLAKLVTELPDNDRHAVVLSDDDTGARQAVRDGATLARGLAAKATDVLLVVDKATATAVGGATVLKGLAGLSPGGGIDHDDLPGPTRATASCRPMRALRPGSCSAPRTSPSASSPHSTRPRAARRSTTRPWPMRLANCCEPPMPCAATSTSRWSLPSTTQESNRTGSTAPRQKRGLQQLLHA